MNNCRAGLYSFALTTAWLRETGMASPPFLVMLGLTLPDSRILNGIASIGLTLTNIAIILPHLRQPIIDNMHTRKRALTDEQSIQEQMNSSIRPNATQQVDLSVESPSLASVSPCDREHRSLPLTCSAIVRSVCSAVTEPSESLDVGPEVAPHTIILLSPEKVDDDRVAPHIHHSLDAGSTEKHVNSSHFLEREGRGPLHIPLPVPDAAEIAFFDTTDAILSNRDLGEECFVAPCAQHTVLEEHSTIEVDEPIPGKATEQDGQLVTTDLPSTPACVEIHEDLTDVVRRMSYFASRQKNLAVASGQAVTDENVPPTPAKVTVRVHHDPVVEATVFHLPDRFAGCGGAVQDTQAGHSPAEGKGALTKRRPESLDFIPQSVIRRYPSAPMASAGRCLGHRTIGSGHDHQVTPMSPHILVHNPATLLEGTRPRATYTTLEGYWRASFLTEVHPKKGLMRGQTFVIETAPAQDPLQQGPASLPESPIVHELTPLRKHPTHRRRLGVLARAALRNRRYTARRCGNNGIDGSSSSDSDSELDSDSEYSSGSSADESVLPHMLGADLLAAIDANSESELNLVGPRRTMRVPFAAYEDFLVSEDSTADVSMVMHVPSNDNTSDSEVRAPATFRSLTHEDIQQWASEVVQRCVRQVCRNRAPAEPSSPSQASDVCAERPSGSGMSLCPLSGLHCKLGAAASAELAAKTKELPVSLPSVSIVPSQKPLSVRNVRDIPEFVPRQRQVSGIAGRIEGSRGLGMRSTIDVTRDAATEVIARMENQAGFNTWERPVCMDEKRMVSMAGVWQGTQRCA